MRHPARHSTVPATVELPCVPATPQLTSLLPMPPPNANCPIQGWSPERSMHLGAAMLEAVLAVAPKLR